MPDNALRYFKHPNARVESSIGEGTRIGAFAHVMDGAHIRAGCNLCDHVFVESDVVIGNRVTVKNGVALWDGVVLEDFVFVGPFATFTNDKNPRAAVRKSRKEFLPTRVRMGSLDWRQRYFALRHNRGPTCLCRRRRGRDQGRRRLCDRSRQHSRPRCKSRTQMPLREARGLPPWLLVAECSPLGWVQPFGPGPMSPKARFPGLCGHFPGSSSPVPRLY
jgi:hypothetical protein